MNKTLILLFLCLSTMTFAQKVKVKKETIFIGGKEFVKIEKHKIKHQIGRSNFIIKTLQGEPLLNFNFKMEKSGQPGVILEYYQVVNPALRDTFFMKWFYYHNAKKLAGFIVKKNLIENNQVNMSAFAQVKKEFDQDMVTKFKNTVGSGIVSGPDRNRNAPIKDEIGSIYVESNTAKHTLYQGRSKIGYVMLKKHMIGETKMKQLQFYLLNNTLIGTINFKNLGSSNLSELVTTQDNKFHNIRAKIDRESVIRIATLLVRKGYM